MVAKVSIKSLSADFNEQTVKIDLILTCYFIQNLSDVGEQHKIILVQDHSKAKGRKQK